MKKFVSIIGSTFLISSALVMTSHASFYGGVGIGFANGSSKVSSDYTRLIALDSIKKTDMSIRGIQGGLFAGYGIAFGDNKYYGGIEVLVDILEGMGKDKHSMGSTPAGDNLLNSFTIKYRHSFNAAVKVGTFLTEKTLVYLKPGFSRLNCNASAKQNPFQGAAKKTKNLNGIRIALGVSQEIISNLSVGVEYSYSQYKKFKFIQDGTTDGITRRQATHQVKPSLNAFMITLTKKF